jgi:hypothetical protein
MEMKTVASESRQHIPLAKAYLCQDCDSVGDSAMHCPACASPALLGLAGVFDRKEELEASSQLLFRALAA